MKFPNVQYESNLWKRGHNVVAGADEVGKGSFAGPVVAGVVAYKKELFTDSCTFKNIKNNVFIRDSKKLSNNQRRIANIWIKKNCVTWGIGKSGVSEINISGLKKATYSAFYRAIVNANIRLGGCIDYLLVDGYCIPYIRNYIVKRRNEIFSVKKDIMNIFNEKQSAIIKGDELSFSIASASILAKVYRDDLMINLASRNIFKVYGWEKNKGYGTKTHTQALQKYGLTKVHRKTFIKTFLKNQKDKKKKI